MWRETGDGHGTTLVATDTGLAAIGIEPDDAPTSADEAPSDAPATDTANAPEAATKARTPRERTRQATLIAMLHTRPSRRSWSQRIGLRTPFGVRWPVR